MPKTKKVKQPKEKNFKLILDANGQKYEAEGKNIHDALSNFKLDYTQVKTKGTITVIKDNKKYEHFYYLAQLRKLLASKVRKFGFARQLELLWANKSTTMSE